MEMGLQFCTLNYGQGTSRNEQTTEREKLRTLSIIMMAVKSGKNYLALC